MQSEINGRSLESSPFLDGGFVGQSQGFEIILASHYGMCFGVRDAIALAEKAASKGDLTILGELVHNDVVRKKMLTLGVREGDLFGSRATTREVMVTAHGAADREKGRWRQMGYAVQDSTCPLVRKAHTALASLVAGGYFPIVIGKRDHIEVRGLTGDFPEARVLEGLDDLAVLPQKAKFGVVSQTTQPIDRVRGLVNAMRRHFPQSEVCFKDTVCQPTKNRQNALRELITKCDLILVVGGSHSNNSGALVQTARNAGVESFLITRAEELSPRKVKGRTRIGVTAGTSTQGACVEKVMMALERMGGIRGEL
ncbi:4-hydroxy-3-methylbut-2-enyl diphosphate reductase [Akkermansiaceae bacterium]|nr:4-hydroxy-3-methylbut-2-enyl diphosphate reductase [Akkermansiaceae bacterium]MDB4537500.1 4-hydroxy-3-methylbut-2-enyl diphosphate reductase [Akkermansiaceae bacterium]